jgi:Peptidase A4 family
MLRSSLRRGQEHYHRPGRLTRLGLTARDHDDRGCRNGPVVNCPRGTTPCLRPKRAAPSAGWRSWLALPLLFLLFMVPATPVYAIPAPTRALITLNWSGYGLAGRAFTAVTGTFNVPAPMPSASCLEQTAIWVGVDGLSNGDLLQAGITETGFTLPTNRLQSDWPPDTPPVDCLGRVETYAWWEDLPTAAVRIAVPINVGDRVTVAIFKISRGWWVVAVHDLTDRHSFLLAQPYGGPQTSVEWVVEAPQVLGNVGDLVPFRAVHFYDLAAQGMPRGLERLDFLSGSQPESPPDAVSNAGQLIRTGFAVHFAD